jgi:hypothetical protein
MATTRENLVGIVLDGVAQELAQEGFLLLRGKGSAARVTYDEAFAENAPPSTWVRTRLLYPTAFNTGEPVPVEETVLFVRELLSSCATGVTISAAGGVALDGRTLERDDHLAVDVWVYDLPALRRLLARWADRLDQRAILLEVYAATRLELVAASTSERGQWTGTEGEGDAAVAAE